ncbi:putative serine/threonine-protein kinase PIX13 isoform X1 [Castanea sativa]|uniref:putative serine/threonine-protein kinase PIX13 isoform X1 n=1 Tax=Castanea sativa TaxID=21020 RepID=UPI003F649397
MAPSFAPYEYEVFVSFRGADNRTGFTSHLFAALDRKTIHAFKDDINLPRGEKIGPELLKAIETSRIAVVVFSKKYAASDWCLDELVKIMECKRVFNQRVLPIFYHVSQPEVLEQKGNFAELPNGPEDKMNSWRAALTEAANLAGLHLEPNRPESEFIEEIVENILKKLNEESSSAPSLRQNDAPARHSSATIPHNDASSGKYEEISAGPSCTFIISCNFSWTGAGTSQTISNKTSSKGSTISAKSQFSAASGDEAYPDGQILPTPNLRIFSFTELKVATKNFRPDTVLGEGGFGLVCKGWLEDKGQSKSGNGMVIAVKKLNSKSVQGFQEWQSEVNVLGRLSHPNLVKLLGYCQEDRELLLIYEFMRKGSLENHLFGRGSAVQPLPWDIRLKIAIGVARGLAFLHTSDKRVIHRDIKTSNILLDESYTAKISDFGLAKLGPSASQSHVTTRVIGTYGYAAPEYVATGHLYVKSDVYGFGVVLVEILTGLRAVDRNRPSGKHNLVDWVKPYLSERSKLKQIMDSRLEGKYPSKAVFHISQLALKCLAAEPKHRPSMKEVLEKLERFEAANERPREPRSHASHLMVGGKISIQGCIPYISACSKVSCN